jgi:hypothetical protein
MESADNDHQQQFCFGYCAGESVVRSVYVCVALDADHDSGDVSNIRAVTFYRGNFRLDRALRLIGNWRESDLAGCKLALAHD